ncbi:uncharacterized protein LOC114330312 [Diabrotica virgifera virgifera]|uniref:Uncharacterized protein LOC114330312 n=1 Tax=Diabrotica virgifera virgifera TaxID=50390 RepID=A0A6P7FK87_DIAVI|nr:uncharacterized protein LOC114330312 [Diabrotica virgifera virgifera]
MLQSKEEITALCCSLVIENELKGIKVAISIIPPILGILAGGYYGSVLLSSILLGILMGFLVGFIFYLLLMVILYQRSLQLVTDVVKSNLDPGTTQKLVCQITGVNINQKNRSVFQRALNLKR